jgi:drug/metabolite transporter (DMT)-like permease
VSHVGANSDTTTKAGLSIRQLLALAARPSWLLGTALLGVAILFQLTSLAFAPLIVVQPLGAVALVVTAIMNSRLTGVKLDAVSKRAIMLCVGGVGLFVTIAAFTAKSNPITEVQLSVVLIILASVLVAFALAFALLRKQFKVIFYIVGAGVLFGFVATLAKVVIDRVKTLTFTSIRSEGIEWLTILCVIALLLAALLGSYFVQSAYSNGPPDLVVAGLTVIDPLVAVAIGIIVLGEAATAPLWAIIAFVVAGGLAIYGVLLLARVHPQLKL